MSVASFAPRGPIHMGFVVEKVVLGQALLRVLKFFPPLGTILPISLLRVLGDKKQCRYSPGQQYTLKRPVLLKMIKKEIIVYIL